MLALVMAGRPKVLGPRIVPRVGGGFVIVVTGEGVRLAGGTSGF